MTKKSKSAKPASQSATQKPSEDEEEDDEDDEEIVDPFNKYDEDILYDKNRNRLRPHNSKESAVHSKMEMPHS